MQDVIQNRLQIKAVGIKSIVNCGGQSILEKDRANASQLMGKTHRLPPTAGKLQRQAGEKNKHTNGQVGHVKNNFAVIQNLAAVIHKDGENGDELGAVDPHNALALFTGRLRGKRLGGKRRCSQRISS